MVTPIRLPSYVSTDSLSSILETAMSIEGLSSVPGTPTGTKIFPSGTEITVSTESLSSVTEIALCKEVSPSLFEDKIKHAQKNGSDDYVSATADNGVVYAGIRDGITLFGMSRTRNIAFAYHFDTLRHESDALQEKVVDDLFLEKFAPLDTPDGYKNVSFYLFLVGGTNDLYSYQLGDALQKVMQSFFDRDCCLLDTSLLNPNRQGKTFITAYLSSEGKLYFYFHDGAAVSAALEKRSDSFVNCSGDPIGGSAGYEF